MDWWLRVLVYFCFERSVQKSFKLGAFESVPHGYDVKWLGPFQNYLGEGSIKTTLITLP